MSGFIGFELISDVNDQIQALNSYFKHFGIKNENIDNKDWFLVTVSKIDKWLDTVNEQDFLQVGNALMHYITVSFKNSSDYDTCAELLKALCDKITSNKYFRFSVDSRLNLFHIWLYANRYLSYSSYFFYYYLIALKHANYYVDFLPSIDEFSEVFNHPGTSEEFNLAMYLEIFVLLRTKFNHYKSVFKFSGFLENLVHSFKKIVKNDTNSVSLIEFDKLVLSFNFIHCVQASVLQHDNEHLKSLMEVVDIAQKGDLVTKNQLLFVSNDIDIREIEDEMRAIKLVHIAKNNESMAYKTIMNELGITISDDLEDFLFNVSEKGLVVSKVDPSSEIVYFKSTIPNIIDSGSVNDFEEKIKNLTKLHEANIQENNVVPEVRE